METEGGRQRSQMGERRVFEGLLEGWQMPRLTPAQPCIHPLDTTQRQKLEPNVTYICPCLEFRGQLIFHQFFFWKHCEVLEFLPLCDYISINKEAKAISSCSIAGQHMLEQRRHNKRPRRFPLMGHLLCFQALE